MRCAPEDDEFDRDERTLDVISWLLPVGAGVAVGLPVLFGVAALLGVDGDLFFTMLIVGLPAIATVVFGVRHSLRTGDDDFGINRRTPAVGRVPGPGGDRTGTGEGERR